jgi:hypothetical protein
MISPTRPSRPVHQFPSVQEVAPDVYAYIQPDGSWWINNTGFIVGSDATVSIDSCATEARTTAYRTSIARVSKQPVRTVINTHHHGDHTNGNYQFREATIIAQRNCRTEMLATGLPGERTARTWEPPLWRAGPAVGHLRRPPGALERGAPVRGPILRDAGAHHQRLDRLAARAIGSVRRRSPLQRRNPVHPGWIACRCD